MLTEWEDYHWESTLEFSRSSEFLKWRFFNNYQKYWFYLEENQNNGSKPMYFVVGKVFWKGVNILMLVDYKLPFGDTKGWKSILKLSKILAKKNNCDAIVTMSSHCFFDKGLKKNLFFRVGKKDLIITNAKIDLPKEKIHDRNFVYATMADSDLEFPFWWS